MTSIIVNSDTSLQSFFGMVRDAYKQHHYLKFSMRTGKDRSLDQNAISHAWYEQLSRELPEDDVLGWKSYCKLHLGVPILLAEDEEYRKAYDSVLKGLSYEQKITAMSHWPVTSQMTVKQLSKYLEAMQKEFIEKGVLLEFPKDE